MTSLILNKYKLIEKIGEGSFGLIYKGINFRTKELVAIKIESIKNQTNLLKNESKIYHYLSNNKGIPIIKWYGKDNENYYMVIDLLGDSLEKNLQNIKTFSLEYVLKIGIYIIELLKTIHEKGLVHRDIKPDNFLYSLKDKNQLYIIDFGFCKTFIEENNKHIKIKKTSSLIGTPNFASINAHEYNELSRRDDLESLGYMLCYFYLGYLEWEKSILNEEIKNMKKNIIYNMNIPEILRKYLKIIQNLNFDEKPNYSMLIHNFNQNN